MYDFYYDYLKDHYGDRYKLLFTDTDSLCCEIETVDIYADMGRNLDMFDTSNFDSAHPQYSQTNRRVLGKFESETGSTAREEFVGLRAAVGWHCPVNVTGLRCSAVSSAEGTGNQRHGDESVRGVAESSTTERRHSRVPCHLLANW